MATKKFAPHRYIPEYGDDPTYCTMPDCHDVASAAIHLRDEPTRIVIERREIVSIIEEHPEGAVGMLEAAWQVAGKYVSENAGVEPIQVEFEYRGWKHTARSEETK